MSVDVDAVTELTRLTEALRAHAELLEGSGAHGLAPAPQALIDTRPSALVPAPSRAQAQAPRGDRLSASRETRGVATAAEIPPPPDERPRSTPAGNRAISPAKADTPPARQASGAEANRSHIHSAPAERGSPPDPSRLTLIEAEVRACTQCALHATRSQTVFARGTGAAGLCFVGEGPGADEDAQGSPFVGKAGQLLDRMIEAMGFRRDDVYVCNIVKCRPPDNRKPDPAEMAACRSFLERQLEVVQPSVIVALGATAVQGLLGSTEGITRLRGRWRLYRGEVAVMPTFHPAYLLRKPAAKREVWADLQAVVQHMGRELPRRRDG